DGVAVGLFNLGEEPRQIGLSPKSIGFSGVTAVRNLWSQTDLAPVSEGSTIESVVPSHGVLLLKLTGDASGQAPVQYPR
ncbi:MAG: hypothetical protein J5764_03965, partial [Bacteroidales bacterium]|nr:hypothetical protein [Bacteroidales bacterium]